MLQNSISFFHWKELVEKNAPEQMKIGPEEPILYVSNLEQAKLFSQNFFNETSIRKDKKKNENQFLLQLSYRGCSFTLNKNKQFDFNGKSPTLSKLFSPFIFYIQTENREKFFNEALENGFKKLSDCVGMKNIELMVFLVVGG